MDLDLDRIEWDIVVNSDVGVMEEEGKYELTQ